MAKSRDNLRPTPVYVVIFADGEVGRMAFASPKRLFERNGTFDFESARRLVCWAYAQPKWSNEMPPPLRAEAPVGKFGDFVSLKDTGGRLRIGPMRPPRDDIVFGHVEWDGKKYRDPAITRYRRQKVRTAFKQAAE